MPMNNTAENRRSAVRFTLIALVTWGLVIGLVGPVMMLTGEHTGKAAAQSQTCFNGAEPVLVHGSSLTESDLECVDSPSYNNNESIKIPALTNADEIAGLKRNDTESGNYNISTRLYYSGASNERIGLMFNYIDDDNFEMVLLGVADDGTIGNIQTHEYVNGEDYLDGAGSIPEQQSVSTSDLSDTWLDIEVYIDNSANELTIKVSKSATGTEVANGTLAIASNSDKKAYGPASYSDGDTGMVKYYDSGKTFSVETYTISGQVTDEQTGDGIANATINITNSTSGAAVANTTTDGSGFYSVSVENGSYDVKADAEDYFSETESVSIDASSVVQDFQLTPQSAALVLRHRTYLEHGQQTPYTVTFQNITNGTVAGTEDVTNSATVTSGNVEVVTVNTNEQTLIATQNTSVNERTYIEATYTKDGKTYTARRNITVANQTTENLEILPGTAVRSSAVLLDTTIQALIVATFVGIIGARVATAFAGLGMMQMTIVAGWFVGYVSVGMAMVGLFTALFVGLNMAANIDYTVRR
jgi:hypothetical protein